MSEFPGEEAGGGASLRERGKEAGPKLTSFFLLPKLIPDLPPELLETDPYGSDSLSSLKVIVALWECGAKQLSPEQKML